MSSRQKLVVIGNGMVGQRLLDRLMSENGDFDVTVLCEEPRAAYDRVQLSAFFSGKSADDLSLVQPGFFDRHGIAIHFSESAVKIDRATREVHTSSGQVVGYDKLVLATGSFPFVPPIAGKDRSHCYVYRTIEDLEAIKAGAKDAKVGVVIGGEQRVERDRDSAERDRAEEGRDEVDRVEHAHRDPLLGDDAQRGERARGAQRAVGDGAVGVAAAVVDHRDPVAAALVDVALQQVVRGVVVAWQVDARWRQL